MVYEHVKLSNTTYCDFTSKIVHVYTIYRYLGILFLPHKYPYELIQQACTDTFDSILG